MKKVLISVFLIVTGFLIPNRPIDIIKFIDVEYEGIAYADQEALPDPDIPETCSSLAQDFERTCYGTKSGDVSYSQQIVALRKIKSCLRKEGLSDAQIKKTLILIKQKASEQLIHDGYVKK